MARRGFFLRGRARFRVQYIVSPPVYAGPSFIKKTLRAALRAARRLGPGAHVVRSVLVHRDPKLAEMKLWTVS